jgi:hypothetical protein
VNVPTYFLVGPLFKLFFDNWSFARRDTNIKACFGCWWHDIQLITKRGSEKQKDKKREERGTLILHEAR